LRTPNTPHMSGRSRRIGSAATATARLLKPAGSRHPWPDEIATHWGQGSKTPLIKVQPQLVVEVAADAALQHGHYRHPLRLIRLRADLTSGRRRPPPGEVSYPGQPALGLNAPLPQMLQGLLQGRDLAEPGPVLRLGEASFGVAGHLLDAWQLGRVDAQEPAPAAGVLVHARCPVGALAVAQGDLAEQEVLLELIPLLAGCGTHLPERPQGAAAFDEELVRGDHLLGKHRGVAAGRVEVQVAQQRGGDVQRQAAGDHLGGEQPPEIVRREPDRPPGLGQTGVRGELVQQPPYDGVGDDLLAGADPAANRCGNGSPWIRSCGS
jgi:hypothetical protein